MKKTVSLLAALVLSGAAFAQVDAWTGPCAVDDLLAGEGDFLASIGPLISLPNDWQQFDIDADGVPDAWQCQLIAYSICSGNAAVAATQASNLVSVNTLVTNFSSLVSYMGTAGPAMVTFGNQLAAAPSAAICDDPASLAAVPALQAGFALVSGALGPFAHISDAYLAVGALANSNHSDYSPFPPVLNAVSDLLAALGGMSTEAGATITGIVPVSDIALFDQASTLLAGIAQFEQSCGTNTSDATLVSNATTALPLIANPPSVSAPTFAILDNGSKAVGEDFAGAGDYNHDGTTNTQIAGFVQGASGGANDFVAGAAGGIDDFWAGNPSLPVAGLFGLGALLAGVSGAGAFTLRRKKK